MSDSSAGVAGSFLAGDTSTSNSGDATASGQLGGPNVEITKQSAGDDTPWFSGFKDDEKGFVEKKGWKSPQDLLSSYRNLEKTMGSERLLMPKGDDDKDGWNTVYDRLGRPKSADEYKFPEGSNPELTKEFAPVFHEYGVTGKAAAAIASKLNEVTARMNEAAEAEFAAKAEQEISQLTRDWGRDKERNLEVSRRTMRAFNLSVEDVASMERAIGTRRSVELLHKIGETLKEDNGADMGGNNNNMGFGMTPSRAAYEISELKNDKDFMRRYQNGDKAAFAKFSNLHRIASGEG